MKINFMSIPKTASCSCTAFTDANGMTKVAHDRKAVFTRRWRELLHKDCDKVMFVLRDPIDRLISAYSYLSAGGTNPADAEDRDIYLAPYGNLEDFILGGGLFDAAVEQIHLHPQYSWLLDIDGTMPYHKMIPIDFHNMEESLKEACEQYDLTNVELPHWNSSNRISHELSEDAEAIVREIYALDYRLIRRLFGR